LYAGTTMLSEAEKVDLSLITHLYIAFLVPDANGQFTVNEDLKKLADLAHSKGVQIFASIAGGNPPAYYSTLINSTNQAGFITSLANLAANHNLDGIDVDLEGALVNASYESFVIGLAQALKAKKKLITAAVATVYGDSYSDRSLAQFDFINIMCYDKTGPWDKNRPGQHAPLQMVTDDLNYWGNARGVKKEKLSIGLPFYGYGFGGNAPESISFADLVTAYPGSENTDEVAVTGGGTIYYNGIPTIRTKALLAKEKAGGIMIWQLRQDAPGPLSLLSLIHTVTQTQTK
jgi:chitinase